MKTVLPFFLQKFLKFSRYQQVKMPFQPTFCDNRWVGHLLTIIFLLFVPSGIWAQDVLVGLTSLGGTENGGTAFSLKSDGTGFTVRKNFVKSGSAPNGNLIKAADGNFYGLNSDGGTYGYGNIFKMSATGKITHLHSFNSANDGSFPQGSLKQGTDDDFYGLAYSGGTNGVGTIYKITANGAFTVLRQLDATADGSNPHDNLTQGTDGDFYGLNSKGGTYGYGTIFKITASGTYSVLRHLNQSTDGSYPYGGLVQGADGNFYGMTQLGGTYGYGTIFRISPGGTFTVRRHLNYTTDGGYANGNNLIKATDGNLYGMLYQGGTIGYGTIFKLTPGGTFTVIKHLDYNTNGGYPKGSLIQSTDGNFYGMMQSGGTIGYGTVFKCTPSGTFTVLKNLDTSTGGNPQGNLLRNSSDGNFYGMTSFGGAGKGGTVFKITPAGSYTVLVHLPESSGVTPTGSVVQGRDGSFYGMTLEGGTYNAGSVFKFCNNTFSALTSFNPANTGTNPQGNLIQGSDGNFYGMTPTGGTYSFGTIFKMTPAGTISVLWNLDKTTDGGAPYGSLVQGADGSFYGMTTQGGTYNYGTIFKITSGGSFNVIWNFDYANDGGLALGSLIKGNDNNLYGMTYYGGAYGTGTIFKLTPGGVLTVIKNLEYAITGGYPYLNSLIQHTDGNLYGMATYGGSYGFGTIFKCTPGGTLTVLRHINTADGVSPRGKLARGSDGMLYGFNSAGGTYNGGTIFKISASGTFNVLRHLNPATDGGIPYGSLVVQKANPVATAQNVTTAANTPKAITLTGSGGNPLTFTMVNQPLNGTLSGSGANRTYKPNAGFTGNDAFTFRVTWGCQQSSVKTVSINVTGNASGTVRLNAGGPAVATSLGNFSADNYFAGTTSLSTTASPIDNTTNDGLYQNSRRATNNGGSFQYNIPVSNGNYTVKLHFAETFHTAAGKRKFNVTAEGASWLTNYDIYAAAGGIRRAIIATKSINVTGGMLNLNFTSVVDKACVAAIEVLPVAGAERLATETNPIEAESELVTSLYPNPVQSQLTVQLSTPVTNLQTTVKDASGMEVLHNAHQILSSDKLQVEAGLLKPGLYLLQLQSNEGYQTIKFLKE